MIRTLLKEVKEYKAASIATPIFMILEVLFENYIDGVLLHKDIFEEKFEEAIHKEMMRQTQDLKEKREKLLKNLE